MSSLFSYLMLTLFQQRRYVCREKGLPSMTQVNYSYNKHLMQFVFSLLLSKQAEATFLALGESLCFADRVSHEAICLSSSPDLWKWALSSLQFWWAALTKHRKEFKQLSCSVDSAPLFPDNVCFGSGSRCSFSHHGAEAMGKSCTNRFSTCHLGLLKAQSPCQEQDRKPAIKCFSLQ